MTVRNRQRVEPTPNVGTARHRVDEHLKGVVERHVLEVDNLKEMRIREINARREVEQELEVVKEKQRKDEEEVMKLRSQLKELSMEKRRHAAGTNLKSKLDEATRLSSKKTEKGKQAATPRAATDQRDIFLKDARRVLKNLTKKELLVICEEEGVDYVKLDTTKKLIANLRADRAVEAGKGERNGVTIQEVSDDGGGGNQQENGDVSTDS
ncbi:hypothetical protein CBR_g3038 [Chara braunii]|uniref:Uncharacterized protein n=1 Tax=Chara braunii TaxID=69332 RepID=A0A388KEL1_CHABU|nr:hypothetical protein CBR_g3038 [Chara braunii]|eukprot:GBG68494.1 hypothetical protein CBR_g3038 [Chara braunii]